MPVPTVILAGVLVLFLLVVGPLRIVGFAPVRQDAEGLGIPYVVYRWLGASEVLCAGLIVAGLVQPWVATGAAIYLAVGAVGAMILHLRAGDPAGRWVSAFCAAALATAVAVLIGLSA
ncbi:DoxX family protein [Kineosporia sp. NBRC 101731]|uniref:DoxX family protein n=1 Tax=Kineosporia sp. NBRC 101731 TaxID=3032199 RepID=UPI0024A5C2AB|nr:DoxX family protein [Kineosporia sp. NBRC 101731]GLY29418.1 hypothetical protein Kisp02_27830 [Kineosporia sp. NBRC 101731]